VPRGFHANPGYSALHAVLSAPEPVVGRWAGSPVVIDGRRLDPATQLLLVLAERGKAGLGDRTVPSRRRAVMRRATALVMPRAKGVHAVDRTIPGPAGPLPVRVYRSLAAPAEPPAIVYFHGGGWVVGDLDTHDGSCRLLARETGAVVMAVDYRLAPEHPFPAAVDDALAAFRWAAANPRELACRPGAVAVMGDSAGGTLAAVVCQQARDLGGAMPVAQGLVYPGTDLRMMTRSMDAYAQGFYLTREDIAWFQDQYVPDAATRLDPRASPLLAEDLSGLPTAHVWTAGFDPLRDEGRAYADRLAASGVVARYRCLDDQIHGFFGMGVLPDGLGMVASVCREMGELIEDAIAGATGPAAPPGRG
jgi:acetyl esterase